ncbi:sensor histidine kinase [Undibacterium terreum]|uniref:Histidine kinase/HSP90-like ATPase domain-containing protein n=1 Tax=Undibacterium terreum TaxID=1224302 RepID=A0A916XIN9_9BURK|nr:ATP-binding protein [Undibacterium terreum]GGC74827.1 hypothetical protein GCM10011396_22570 [Undibacterium terreum]
MTLGSVWLICCLSIFVCVCVCISYRRRYNRLILKERERLTVLHRDHERVARNSYDVLLQGLQGITLRCQLAVNTLPAGVPTRVAIEKVLDDAEQLVVVSRETVVDTRSPMGIGDNLIAVLDARGSQFSADYGIAFELIVEGRVRSLLTLAGDEIYSIAIAAMSNAFRHSKARRISVTIVFGHANFEISIQDDGIGFQQEEAEEHRPWGLEAMEERAQKLGGHLTICSGLDKGTEISFNISSGLVYSGLGMPLFLHWLH